MKRVVGVTVGVAVGEGVGDGAQDGVQRIVHAWVVISQRLGEFRIARSVLEFQYPPAPIIAGHEQVVKLLSVLVEHLRPARVWVVVFEHDSVAQIYGRNGDEIRAVREKSRVVTASVTGVQRSRQDDAAGEVSGTREEAAAGERLLSHRLELAARPVCHHVSFPSLLVLPLSGTGGHQACLLAVARRCASAARANAWTPSLRPVPPARGTESSAGHPRQVSNMEDSRSWTSAPMRPRFSSHSLNAQRGGEPSG